MKEIKYTDKFQELMRLMFRSAYLKGSIDALNKKVFEESWEDYLMNDFNKILKKAIPNELDYKSANNEAFFNQRYGFNKLRKHIMSQLGLKDE